MGNFNDDFDNDDLFGDDDFGNDGFGFDDDFDDDFDSGFGGDTLADDSSGFGFDDDDDFDAGFGDDDGFGDVGDLDSDEDMFASDEDMPDDFAEQEEVGSGSGFRRWVMILGGAFAVQVIVIILLLVLGGGDSGPSDFELTSTAVFFINATTFAEGTERAEMANQQATEIVLAQSVTPTPTTPPTNTPRPSFTPSFTPDLTEMALANIEAEQTAAAEQTVSAAETSAATTPTPTEVTLDIEGTSTALAQAFLSVTETFAARTPMDGDLGGQGGGAEATPTPEGGTGGTTSTGGATTGGGLTGAGELPDAGLFDNFAAGNSLGAIALAAFGLLGVIAFARRMRDDDDE